MPTADGRPHLLILGGTGEAAALAAVLSARYGEERLLVTSSLAGRTAAPAALAGRVRSGGFGGAGGLADYLTAAGVDLVIDATHPFAARISAQAQQACDAARVPRLMLRRPAWTRHPRDRWIEVASAAEAASLLPGLGRRVWLTIGQRALDAFAELRDLHFVIRTIDPPAAAPPLASYEIIGGRGPFTLADERLILERHGIEVLVTRASGGVATEAKLVAARERSLPVVMLRRPPAPPGTAVTSVDSAVEWVGLELARVKLGREMSMTIPATRRFLVAGALVLGCMPAWAQGLNTPVWYTLANAAEQNKEEDVATLIRRGDNPNFVDSTGRTPLSYAASSGNATIAKMLLDGGARVDYRDNAGATALHWAAQTGHVELITMLMAAKATVDAQNKQGITPLMMAAANGKVDAIRALLAAGADPKKQDFTGRDALGWAAGKPASLRALQGAHSG